MKEYTLKPSKDASPPIKSEEYRHFFEKQNDGSWVPVTYRLIRWGDGRYSAYEYAGRTYEPHMIAAMVRAGILSPVMTPSQQAEYLAAAA